MNTVGNDFVNESERLKDLLSYQILDTLPENELDEIAKIAALSCDMPISLISLIDEERHWFKSTIGFSVSETTRSDFFCHYTLANPEEVLVVSHPHLDNRFQDNDLVTSKTNIRFYAGAPLISPQGNVLGTLCVLDNEFREISDSQIEVLKLLAKRVMDHLNTRKTMSDLAEKIESNAHRLQMLTSNFHGAIYLYRLTKDGKNHFEFASGGLSFIHPDLEPEYIIQNPESVFDNVHPEDLPIVKKSMAFAVETMTDWNFEYRVINKDQITRWHRGKAKLEQQPNGDIMWYGTIQDISLQKEYENTLEKISFDISHVLRRPVATLLGLVNLFEDLSEANQHEKEQIVSNIKLVSAELDDFTRKLYKIYDSKKSELTSVAAID